MTAEEVVSQELTNKTMTLIAITHVTAEDFGWESEADIAGEDPRCMLEAFASLKDVACFIIEEPGGAAYPDLGKTFAGILDINIKNGGSTISRRLS